MNKTTKQLPACEEMPETGREHYPDLKKEKKKKKRCVGNVLLKLQARKFDISL